MLHSIGLKQGGGVVWRGEKRVPLADKLPRSLCVRLTFGVLMAVAYLGFRTPRVSSRSEFDRPALPTEIVITAAAGAVAPID